MVDRSDANSDEAKTCKVSDLLSELLRASFTGRQCIDPRQLVYQPKEVVYPDISRNYFSTRIKAADGRCVNVNCADKLRKLYDFALNNGHPDLVRGVPGGVIDILLKHEFLSDEVKEAVGARAMAVPLKPDEKAFITKMVDALVDVMKDKAFVDCVAAADEVDKEARKAELVRNYLEAQKSSAIGMSQIAFYRSHANVGYDQLFAAAKHKVDIVNVHGRSWIGVYRDVVREALSKEGLAIRVAFLSPWRIDNTSNHKFALRKASDHEFSPEFEAFCMLREYSSEDMAKRTGEAIESWIDLYHEACEMSQGQDTGIGHAELQLFLGNWYPAQTIYRIDHHLILRPANNINSKTRDYSYGYYEDSIMESEYRVFSSYVSHIEMIYRRCVQLELDEVVSEAFV